MFIHDHFHHDDHDCNSFINIILNTLTFSTTSTLSVGSTGSQARLIQSSHAPAMYQPILMKDLGKIKTNENVSKTGNGGGGDDEEKITEQVMDRHLSELVANNIEKTGTMCDIAKYMANLKEKHLESEQKLEYTSGNQRVAQSAKMSTGETNVDIGAVGKSKDDEDINTKQSSEDDEAVVIDRRVDKVFIGEKSAVEKKEAEVAPKRTLKSPCHSTQLHSPERSNYVSPIKIIKVRSPHGSLDASRRSSASLSRESSRDRRESLEHHQHRQSFGHVRRASEGGILKTTYSAEAPTAGMGILKRSVSPKSRSADRQSSLSSRKSLSPGTSFDSRSPDRYRLSPHSFDNRSPERPSSESCYAELDFRRHMDRIHSNQSSFDSRSPGHDRKRSLSAHSNFARSAPRHDLVHYQYYPHDYYYYSHSPEQGGKRQSKSLERASNRGEYTAGRHHSPERIYQIGLPLRSQSAESAITRNGIHLRRSNESLARSIEQPTCVECLYQRKPS